MELTIELLDRLAMEARVKDSRPGWLKQLPGSVRPSQRYYRFLFLLCRELRPGKVLELGVCRGVSGFHLAAGVRPNSGHVWGVDCNPQLIPKQLLARTDYTFILGEAVRAAPKLARQGPFDVIFFDTVHLKEQITDEVAVYTEMMSRPGLQLFDNLRAYDMGEFWAELEGEKTRMDWLCTGGRGGFGARIVR